MPTWGLSSSMRQVGPWGLSEDLLEPAKTQTDPIHGDIYWSKIEARIIDSKSMQRLRHVKQLGMTLKVYPGAEHSRFTHLLGTMATAQQILDKIYSSADGPHAMPSLLTEWRDDPNPDLFHIKWGEATVLARLAALLHDLTHVPYGHTIEDDLEVLESHDKNEARFSALWQGIDPNVRGAIESARTLLPQEGREVSLFEELKAIILDKVSLKNGDESDDEGNEKPRSSYPFVADVVNNTICADLLDYIARDHYFLGLPFAVGDRFMDHFYVVPSDARTKYCERLVVRLVRDGESRRDVRTEVLKYLRYRYEETERALYHKTKLAYDAMLGKMLEMWKDSLWFERAVAAIPDLAKDSRSLDASWLKETVGKAGSAAGPVPTVQELDDVVEAELERYFRFFGDEGLLEHLIWSLQEKQRLNEAALPGEHGLDEREEGILNLARRIRYRDHFRLLGQFSGSNVLGIAQEKYDAYRHAGERRELEKRAAKFAGLSPAWKVILWIPSPKMRLKIAEVLVQENNQIIRKLARASPSDPDRAGGDPDAALIVDRHTQLWALRIYGPGDIRENDAQSNRLLGYLKRELGLPLIRWDGVAVDDLERQAADHLGDQRNWSQAQRRRATERFKGLAARRNLERFDDLVELWGDEEP